MSHEKGWVKLYRDIEEHWVWKDPALLRCWLYLLIRANHEQKEIRVKRSVIKVGRGQIWTSIRKLAEKWECSEKTVLVRLGIFKKEGMILVDSRRNSGTLITVHNYGVYQDFSSDEESYYSNKVSNKVETKWKQSVPESGNKVETKSPYEQ